MENVRGWVVLFYLISALGASAVTVVNEDIGPGMPRWVPVVDGAFTDTFHGEDVHVYRFTKPARFGE